MAHLGLIAACLLLVSGAVLSWRGGVNALNDCPCSIWDNGQLTGTPLQYTGSSGQTFGVKIHADSPGYLKAVRFYKSFMSDDTTHTVHVWDTNGNSLASAVSSNESSVGWQEVQLPTGVPIAANTTYIISYYAPLNTHTYSLGEMTNQAGNGVLHADANGSVFASGDTFPNTTTTEDAATNFWVDAVFTPADSYTAPFTVTSSQPKDGAYGVTSNQPLSFTLGGPADAATVGGTVLLTDANSQPVSGVTSYDAGARVLSFTPAQPLTAGMAYTATVSNSLKDVYGTAITPFTTHFTVGSALSTDINQGLGGPVLIVTSSTQPYDKYLAEILRAEGITYFTVKDIAAMDATLLSQYKVLLLGESTLTTQQVTDLTSWVNNGGHLISMRPDKQLSGLLGLTDTATTASEGYLKVDASKPPGAGITTETMQYHTTADRYDAVSGTDSLATLYSDATTALTNPAVTSRVVGSGTAAAWTFDLPKSIALTHQGNPAWAGQDRDGNAPIRPNDLFNGSGGSDWLDLTKAHIPQADEQQRLLINMILTATQANNPLPRFWVLPHGHSAALIMEEDDHATTSGTRNVFAKLMALSDPKCSAADWECARGGSMLYTSSGFGPQQAVTANKLGFGVGVHVSTGCNDYTSLANLQSAYSSDISSFQSKYTGLPPQRVSRTHCYVYSDWDSTPKVDVANGIRLNLNYEWYPPSWTGGNTGYLTGSGMTMRFTDSSGNLIDDYQGVTDLDYETDPTSASMNAVLDNTQNANQFYGAIGTHYDSSNDYDELLAAAARARNIPMVSAEQYITWKDALGSSAFTSLTSSASQLKFTVEVAQGGTGMQTMVPASTGNGSITSLKRDGSDVAYASRTVKGVDYVVFDAAPGIYQVQYGAVSFKSADINEDGVVDYLDFSNLASQYGQSGAGLGRSDINLDGKVDYLDFSILAGQYGT